MRYFGIFLILIGFAVILSANAYAMPSFNSQEIYDFSNVIAVGKVISVNSTFSPIHNLYEIKVEKFLKNQQDSDVLFAAGQKTINIRLGNQVFDVNDRGLFYLTNNTIGYDPYSGIFLVYPTSQLIEPEWDKCNIFDKEIPREHWVFGGTGQMPAVRQGNNTDIENFAIGKQVLVSYDIFNHLPDAKNVTFGIMIKKIDEPDYLYTETNSYLLEPCVPYKTLTWTFTPTKSGQYAAEIYDAGSQMGVGFTAKSLPLCTSDRTACFQDEYICDPAGWECVDTKNIFNTVIDSPLKQIKAGIALVDVQCSDEKYPAIRHDRMRVACVSLDTESKLVMRGWATMRLAMPGDNVSEALCNNYKGKWHKEYNGCRDISDLQCSLIGGKFDVLKICENGICPDRDYEICVTENENCDEKCELERRRIGTGPAIDPKDSFPEKYDTVVEGTVLWCMGHKVYPVRYQCDIQVDSYIKFDGERTGQLTILGYEDTDIQDNQKAIFGIEYHSDESYYEIIEIGFSRK